MKIFLVGRYNPGIIKSGPEKFSKRLFEFLLNDNKSNEIYFLSFYFKELVDGTLFNRLLGFSLINSKNNIIKVGVLRLFILLLKEKPDIVHVTTGERFTIAILLYRLLLKFSLITTLHSVVEIELFDAPINMRLKGLLFEKLVIKCSDAVVFVSPLLLNSVKKYYKLKQKCFIIPNGVDKEYNFFIKKSFYILDKLNLVFYNGFDKFIKRGLESILGNLKLSKFKKISIDVVGIKTEMDEEISGIEIINHGFLKKEELIKFWEDKHFFIKSRLFDSFPIMLLEAMATGVIPIISDNVGVSEYIKNGENGFLYSKDEEFGLVKVLNDIYDGKYNLEKISLESSKIKDKLRWELVLDKYLDLYNLL